MIYAFLSNAYALYVFLDIALWFFSLVVVWYFARRSGFKAGAASTRKKKKKTAKESVAEASVETGIRFVTRSRMFRIAFWPWARIHEDRIIKKARREL